MRKKNYGQQQAKAQMQAISEMVRALQCDYDRLQELRDEYAELSENEVRDWQDAGELADLEEMAGDCKDLDEAQQRITADPLSVEVRSAWVLVGDKMEPEEFRIVLCTGGPHVELRGELDEYKQPCKVSMHYADWGTSGEFREIDEDVLLTYCQQFFFGE